MEFLYFLHCKIEKRQNVLWKKNVVLTYLQLKPKELGVIKKRKGRNLQSEEIGSALHLNILKS